MGMVPNEDANDMKGGTYTEAHVTRKEHVPKIQHITNHTQQKRGRNCHFLGDFLEISARLFFRQWKKTGMRQTESAHPYNTHTAPAA